MISFLAKSCAFEGGCSSIRRVLNERIFKAYLILLIHSSFKTGDDVDRPLAAWKDSNHGCGGLAAQSTVPAREHRSTPAPEEQTGKYSHGHPRGGGGRMRDQQGEEEDDRKHQGQRKWKTKYHQNATHAAESAKI